MMSTLCQKLGARVALVGPWGALGESWGGRWIMKF